MTKKERIEYLKQLGDMPIDEIMKDEVVQKWNVQKRTILDYQKSIEPTEEVKKEIPELPVAKKEDKEVTFTDAKITVELLESQLTKLILKNKAAKLGITSLKAARSYSKNIKQIVERYAQD